MSRGCCEKDCHADRKTPAVDDTSQSEVTEVMKASIYLRVRTTSLCWNDYVWYKSSCIFFYICYYTEKFENQGSLLRPSLYNKFDCLAVLLRTYCKVTMNIYFENYNVFCRFMVKQH